MKILESIYFWICGILFTLVLISMILVSLVVIFIIAIKEAIEDGDGRWMYVSYIDSIGKFYDWIIKSTLKAKEDEAKTA
jgi:hypothetical protein